MKNDQNDDNTATAEHDKINDDYENADCDEYAGMMNINNQHI